MSVRANERDESSIEFLKVLRDIEKWCICKSETCPKKYRFIINNQLLTRAANAYSYAKMANSIKVINSTTKELRENYTSPRIIRCPHFFNRKLFIIHFLESSFCSFKSFIQ